MPKGTCPTETMSSSEKIKPVALVVIKYLLSQSLEKYVLKIHSNLLGRSEGLIFPALLHRHHAGKRFLGVFS